MGVGWGKMGRKGKNNGEREKGEICPFPRPGGMAILFFKAIVVISSNGLHIQT